MTRLFGNHAMRFQRFLFIVVMVATHPQVVGAVELQDGLVGYWPLDAGSGDVAAEDFGAVMDVGELRNEPVWLRPSEAKLGDSALLFDGFEQDVFVPQSDDLDIGTNAVSLSAWVSLDVLPSDLEDTFGGIYDSSGDNYVLYLDKANQELRFKVTDEDGTAERPGVSETLLGVDTWGHVLGVYDGDANTAKIYFNGELVDTHTNPSLGASVLPGQIASIGANVTLNPEVPASRFFPGAIDDVAVWNRPLGLAEASYLYNGGAGNAVGMANPDIEFVSDVPEILPVAPSVQPVVYLGFEGDLLNSGTGGDDFNGFHLDEPNLNDALYTAGRSGQALDLRENPVSNPLGGDSVVVDYELTEAGTIVFDYTASEYYNFQSLWTNSVDANDWEMWIYSDGRVRGRVDGNSFVQFSLENLEGVDETYQIAFTWEQDPDNANNVAVKLFIDGEQRDQDLVGNWVDPGESIFIGAGDETNHFGNGIWDEFKIYDVALSAGEVKFLYSELEPGCDPESAGDVNGDGKIDFNDFLVLSTNFGQMVDSHEEGDINCNGSVEFTDFLVLSTNFGKEVGAVHAVPEPSGSALLAVGLLIGLRHRRRR